MKSTLERELNQYVKLLKGKRLKSVAPFGIQPCSCLVYFPLGGSMSGSIGGERLGESGSIRAVL